MTKGGVIEVAGMKWYQDTPGTFYLCGFPETGVRASITSDEDGGYSVVGYVTTDDTVDIFDGQSWFISLDDAMKAVTAWVTTLRLQGKLKEGEDEYS